MCTVASITDGVVPYIGITETPIQLAYMENGDLRKYLEQNSQISCNLQLSWFRQMAQIIANIHDRRAVGADLSSRNFLLAAGMSLKLCEFSEAQVLPRDADMETADQEGFSVQTDIGGLGTVIYEIITGRRVTFDAYQDFDLINTRAKFPRRDTLPSAEGLWLGHILERCWVERGFRNARCLLEALGDVDLQHLPEKAGEISFSIQEHLCTPSSPVIALSVAFGAVVLLTWLRRHQ